MQGEVPVGRSSSPALQPGPTTIPSGNPSQRTLQKHSPPCLFPPSLQAAHAPPDSSCHWLLPVANPRDWRRHAPPLLLLLLAQHAAAWPQARVLSRMLRAVVGDAASGHKVAVPRCVSTRPWQRHRSPAPQKFSGRRTDCDPALSSAWRTGGVVVEAGVCRGPGWLGGDFQGTASLTRTRRNSSGGLSQLQSLLMFPRGFGLVLALGTVHQAPILGEANNTDSYSLSLVWALHGAPRRFPWARDTRPRRHLERAPASVHPDLPRKGGSGSLLFCSCPQDSPNSQAEG